MLNDVCQETVILDAVIVVQEEIKARKLKIVLKKKKNLQEKY